LDLDRCIFWSTLPCFDPQVTNLGRRGFQSIFRNLASYIWSETIQAQRFVTKSKCQASSRNKVELRVAKVYNWSKYFFKSKLSQKLDLVFQKIRLHVEHHSRINDHVTSSLRMSSDNMKQIVYNNLKNVPCVGGGIMAIETKKN